MRIRDLITDAIALACLFGAWYISFVALGVL
jgi:hypothetical protein